MKTILDQIIAAKHEELQERKSLYPIKLLEKSIYFETPPLSLKKYLCRAELSGIIAEFKRRSPSKGEINPYADVERTTIGYMQAGASALSVLTDETFFSGKNQDLMIARKFNFCPILRKDFIIDEYQIIEAKSIGADAILLIASALNASEIKRFGKLATSLGMEILLEIHTEIELEKITDEQFLAGVNNRNLQQMETQLETAFKLAEKLPKAMVKVAESGLKNPETIVQLKEAGYQGFLIGEHFMLESRPEKACRKFIKAIKSLKNQTIESHV
ncbi:MAG: indole-3-glycerol phosphate synthase TrpC [Bacteroidales bacterium]|jgi:indole-3-glycerol phosphate synthase|nr:indole-3-glycerol phosphate synthase TrpC [Bacteroidales bacterium]